MTLIETITIPAVKYCQTLMGYGRDTPYPRKYGNSFKLLDTRDFNKQEFEQFCRFDKTSMLDDRSIRVLNMVAENFDKSCTEHLIDGQLQIRHYEQLIDNKIIRHALIIDPRIPRDWLKDALNLAGTWGITEVMESDVNSFMSKDQL